MNSPLERISKDKTRKNSDLGAFLVLGTTMAAWLTAGVLSGRYVDVHFGLSPWGIISGALLGIAGSAYAIFDAIRKLDSTKKPNHKP